MPKDEKKFKPTYTITLLKTNNESVIKLIEKIKQDKNITHEMIYVRGLKEFEKEIVVEE